MGKNTKIYKKILTSFCVSSLLGLTILFFGPSFLYFSNISEYSYYYSSIWYYLITIALAISIIVSLITFVVKSTVYEKIIVLVFSFGLLFWIQGNILVWKYGVLDGREIVWADYILNDIVDILVWTTVLFISFIKSNLLFKYVKKVSIFLLALQIMSLAIMAYTTPKKNLDSDVTASSQSQFNFSKKKNVIVLVLDTFQSDVFQEIINENGYESTFDGFTYFRNAIGGFTNTYPSIPLILTGEYYDNSISIHEFYKKIYTRDSLLGLLKENNYDINIQSSLLSYNYAQSNDSNSFNALVTNRSKNISSLIDITFFRYFPQVVKKYFHTSIINEMKYKNGKGDLDFLNGMIYNGEKSNGNNVFKFFHLNGAHQPFNLNENLQFTELQQNREGYITQSKAVLKIVEGFLNKLKEIGAYDNSIIYIVGDHGALQGDFGFNTSQLENNIDDNKSSLVPQGVIANAIPLILYKPFENHGELDISDAPVSLSDVPKTIATELGIVNRLPGCSMLDINNNTKRDRRFLWYNWEKSSGGREYLPDMIEYVISGFSWSSKSWRLTYHKYTSKGVIDSTPKVVKPGQMLTFGKNGTISPYILDGWYAPEDGFTWSSGKTAKLYIPIESNSDILMEIKASPYLASNKLKNQKVNVVVNNQKVGEWAFSGGVEKKSVVIPNDLVKDETLNIMFELPDAVSPLEMEINNDVRVLAIALSSLTLEEITKYEYNTIINFGVGGNYGKYQTAGWFGPENGFNWSEAKSSLIVHAEETESDLSMSVKLVQSLQQGKKVDILVNGQKAGEWNFKDKKVDDASLIIKNELIKENILNITFVISGAKSPKDMGINGDERVIGMGVKSIVLQEINK